MEDAHTVWHQITTILGLKQCTATQMLGICLEFWVGAAVALGIIKVKALYGIKKQLEQIKSSKSKKSKNKKKKRRRK